MQVANEMCWVGGGLVGVAVGAALPAPFKGLEFALCALFVVLTLDAFHGRREIPSVLLAPASIGLALIVAPGTALFVALLLFVVLLFVRYAVAGRRASIKEAVDA